MITEVGSIKNNKKHAYAQLYMALDSCVCRLNRHKQLYIYIHIYKSFGLWQCVSLPVEKSIKNKKKNNNLLACAKLRWQFHSECSRMGAPCPAPPPGWPPTSCVMCSAKIIEIFWPTINQLSCRYRWWPRAKKREAPNISIGPKLCGISIFGHAYINQRPFQPPKPKA